MNNLVAWCIATAALFILAERLFPARKLPQVETWWWRVVAINLVQAGIVILGGYIWDPFFASLRFFNFFESFSPLLGGALGYFVLTFIYYWWHRFRHDVSFFWKWLHQIHHSPTRIETITSFYKHPFEIMTNTIITSLTCYALLGLSLQQTAWAIYFLATAEYIYHMNLRTPVWMGYFIQRPEMHRLHHMRGHHKHNYADLPIWDILFGTFKNPEFQDEACGMGETNEQLLLPMMAGKVVDDNP